MAGRSVVNVELLGAPIDRSMFDVPVTTEPPDPSVKEIWGTIQYDQYSGTNSSSRPAIDDDGNLSIATIFKDGNPQLNYISITKYSSEGEILIHRTSLLPVSGTATYAPWLFKTSNGFAFVGRYGIGGVSGFILIIGFDNNHDLTYVKRYESSGYACINTVYYARAWDKLLFYDRNPSGFWDSWGVDMEMALVNPDTGEIILTKKVDIPQANYVRTESVEQRPDNTLALIMRYGLSGNQTTTGAYMATLDQNLNLIYQRSYEGITFENATPFGIGWAVTTDVGLFLLDNAYQPYKRYALNNMGYSSTNARFYQGAANILYLWQGSNGITLPSYPGGSAYNAMTVEIDMLNENINWATHYGTSNTRNNLYSQVVKVDQGIFYAAYDQGTRVKLVKFPFITSKPVANPIRGDGRNVIFLDNPASTDDNLAAYTEYNPIEHYNSNRFTITEAPISSYEQTSFNWSTSVNTWTEQVAPEIIFFDTQMFYATVRLVYPFD
jgi:hypothetical protein